MNNRKEYSRKPRKCPNCGSNKIASILFGLPAFNAKLETDMKEGRIVLGGCCVFMDDPTWECTNCHMQYYRKEKKNGG